MKSERAKRKKDRARVRRWLNSPAARATDETAKQKRRAEDVADWAARLGIEHDVEVPIGIKGKARAKIVRALKREARAVPRP